MKRAISLLLCAAMLTLSGCGQTFSGASGKPEGGVYIELSDDGITVNDAAITSDKTAAVYAANDIVYYEEGKDFTYGEGEAGDAHSAEEAAAHTVVTITQPGTYFLSGKLSAGQIAVDLGKEAEDDPNAVVTLFLNGVDITCTVAPAIIFYNVYECGDEDNPTKDVDTSAAGANVIIGDSTQNNISGSYVARIYEPGTVELSEDGTEVADADKLHKYDAAFYSRMSMNISQVDGGNGSGVLNISAENEGLDSEMHLTINGGTINIKSGNDGINTNEDGVSVTTINGGNVCIEVTGQTGEGDGIDSNGWLVINGGKVVASACNNSADSGIDSDMGIHIGAGATVIATGHMLDRIGGAEQNYAVFQFNGTQSGDAVVSLKNADGAEVMALWPINDYSILIYSSPELTAGDYTLWSNDAQLGHSGVQTGGMGGFAGGGGRPGGMMPGGNMQMPEGFDPENMPELPEGMEAPEDFDPSRMERPEMPDGGREQFQVNEDGTITLPDGTTVDPTQFRPQGGMGRPGGWDQGGGQSATEAAFTIQARENYFSGVGELSE